MNKKIFTQLPLSPYFSSPQFKYKKIQYVAPKTRYYFAYGSNLSRSRMAQRGAIWEHAQRGTLNNYTLDFSKEANLSSGEGYATIKESKGNRVEGIIYRLEDKEMAKKIDSCEGIEIGQYKRIEVQVMIKNGKKINCFTYIACKRHKGLLPSKKYLNHLLSGKHYLSNEYYKWLQEFGHTIDRPCKIFVYGTLKEGYGNHHMLSGHSDMFEAEVNGQLYVTGLPYATIPNADIYHSATGKMQEDYKEQELLQKDLDNDKYWGDPYSDSYIKGELYIFNNWDILQTLDRLEGFTPGNPNSHYHRVLTSCHDYDGTEFSCWIYISKGEFNKNSLVKDGEYKKQVFNTNQYSDTGWRKCNVDNEEYDPYKDPSWIGGQTLQSSWNEDEENEIEGMESLFKKGDL